MFSVTHFCTAGLQARDQFDAWRSLHKNTIELFPSDERSTGFAAEFSSWTLGELILTHVVYEGAPSRQWRHRPKSYLDHWCVVLARTTAADGSSSQHLSFRSLALPFEGQAQDTEVITLYVPRDRGTADEQRFNDAHGLELSRELAPLLSGYMDNLVRQLRHVSPEYAANLEMPTRALVTACVTPPLASRELARHLPSSVLIERVRAVVRQNMASPEFGPDQLARLLAMSRSKLYRLFESSGGVAHFINKERLSEAQARLSSYRSTLSIHAIGNEVGFADHSTFSRAFRREFGCSPTEARERGFVRLVAEEPDAG